MTVLSTVKLGAMAVCANFIDAGAIKLSSVMYMQKIVQPPAGEPKQLRQEEVPDVQEVHQKKQKKVGELCWFCADDKTYGTYCHKQKGGAFCKQYLCEGSLDELRNFHGDNKFRCGCGEDRFAKDFKTLQEWQKIETQNLFRERAKKCHEGQRKCCGRDNICVRFLRDLNKEKNMNKFLLDKKWTQHNRSFSLEQAQEYVQTWLAELMKAQLTEEFGVDKEKVKRLEDETQEKYLDRLRKLLHQKKQKKRQKKQEKKEKQSRSDKEIKLLLKAIEDQQVRQLLLQIEDQQQLLKALNDLSLIN